jgi:hypothetical protein
MPDDRLHEAGWVSRRPGLVVPSFHSEGEAWIVLSSVESFQLGGRDVAEGLV